MVAPGDIVADRFRLIAPLGEGGMGAVWRAEHIHLEIQVAVKLMKTDPPPGERLRKRFEREARMAAKINSAHVVRVIDHGYHGDVPFIAMELMDGHDLRAELERRGRLTLADTATMVHHVARALGQAHELGLIHRDIKPDNIFVSTDEDGRPLYKVLDFGVVKNTFGTDGGSTFATGEGVLVGTPYYLSPEQAEATGIIDHRSDLWSLGVVAYECLAGRLPFEASTLGRLIVEILGAPVPAIGEVELPAPVTAWLRRSLSKSPNERFGDARLMAESFRAAVKGAPTWSEPRVPRAVVAPVGSNPGVSSSTISSSDTVHSDDAAHVPDAEDATVDAPMGVRPRPRSDLGTLDGAARNEIPTIPTRRWPFAVLGLGALLAVGFVGLQFASSGVPIDSATTVDASATPPTSSSRLGAATAGELPAAKPTTTVPKLSGSRSAGALEVETAVPASTTVKPRVTAPQPPAEASPRTNEPEPSATPSPGPSPTSTAVPGTSPPQPSSPPNGLKSIRRDI